MQKQLLLVVGPGRSGTSVFSAIGQRLGYHIPQPEVTANETNPRGFGEPQWVVDFHTQLLGDAGVLISDARPQAWDLARECSEQTEPRRQLRRWLEQEFTASDRVLVKDPRTLWFFEMWKDMADELGIHTSYVTMLRHPAEVILSRHTWYSTRVPTTGVLSGLLNTMLGTEQLTRGAARSFVDFDQLMADWQATFTRVDTQLGTSLLDSARQDQRAAADELIDPDLRRSVASWDEVEVHTRLRVLAEDCWQELRTLAEHPTDEGASARLEEHRRTYDALYEEAEAVATSSAIALLREERGNLRRQAREEARATQGSVPVRVARLVPERVRRAVPHEVRRRALDLLRSTSRSGQTAPSTQAPARAIDPRTSWEERQDLVRGVVDELGCTWFAVPHDHHTWAVAIPETHRRRFFEALSAAAPEHVRCTALDDRRRRRGTWAVHEPMTQLSLLHVPAVAIHDTAVLPDSTMRPSDSYRCEVEFWSTREDGSLIAPRRNRVGVPVLDPTAVDATTTDAAGAPTAPVLRTPAWNDVLFPVDVVFLWVDDADPEWNARRREYADTSATADLHHTSLSEARFRNRDELRYALRSVHWYAPWVRRIHLVTAGQRPDWLADDPGLVTVVDHTEIFDEACLPTFNSNAIISRLHHIPALADHYILMNDDVFLARPVGPELFFSPTGAAKFFLSPRQIAIEPADDETALDVSRRHVREQILREHGFHATRLLYHTPHPQRRSWHEALEERYPDQYAKTAQNRFRDPSDLEPLLLHDYLGYAEHQTEPGHISYRYAQTGSRTLKRVLAGLKSKPESLDTFCLNDVAARTELDEDTVGDLLYEFLSARFPLPAPWERDQA